jgi:hypothetical protein
MTRDTEIKIKDAPIGPKSRVPLYWVASICVATYFLTSHIDNKLDKIDNELDQAVMQQQQQDWLDNFRDSNPTVHVPALPKRGHQSDVSQDDSAIVEEDEVFK